MPSKNSAVRKDGLYEYKKKISFPDGTEKRKSFYSSVSLKDAKTKAEEYQTELLISAKTGSFITENILFKNWCERYLETYKYGKISDTTYNTLKQRCKKYIYPHFGDMPVSKIKAINIQAFFDLPEIYGLSSSVKVKIKDILNGAFETAIQNDLCYKNPVKTLVLPPYKKVQEKHTYTAKEQRLIVDYVKKHDDCPKEIAILLKTGLRRGELLALKWDDIDFELKLIHVTKAVKASTGKPLIGPPKTKAGVRIVLFDDELLEILSSMNRTVTYKQKEETVTFESPYVIHTAHGQVYQVNNWTNRVYKPAMKKIADYYKEKKIELLELTPHELRHTFGTTLYDNGVDLRTIQKTMGHANLNITSNLYVHDNIETMRKALKY